MELVQAIGKRNIESVRKLIVAGADVNYVTTNNDTPLIVASRNGYTDIGVLLIGAGANYNYSSDGETPLTVAANYDKPEFVILLLEQPDIELDHQDNEGFTALWYAVRHNSVDIIDLLIGSGANPNLPLEDPPIFRILEHTLDIPSLRALLESPTIDLEATNRQGRTALQSMIHPYAHGKEEAVQLLLEAGADPNVTTESGVTLLMEAAYVYGEIIHILVDYAADVNAQNALGQTALMYGVSRSSLSALLGVPSIDLDIQDRNGWTALMLAVSDEDRLSTNELVKAGADPLVKNIDGRTALDLAKKDYLKPILQRAEVQYNWRFRQAKNTLGEKLLISQKLRPSVGGSKDISDHIIKQAEFDNLCVMLQRNTKPNVQALARSLKIPLGNKSKTQLCIEISDRLRL
jgi:ankyrin repeat protein